MKIQTATYIESSTSDKYWKQCRASIYGQKASYKYVLTYDHVVLVDVNSDTGERNTVVLSPQAFYDGLDYFGTYQGNPLNVLKY